MQKLKNSLLFSIGIPVVIVLFVIMVIFFSFHHSPIKAHKMNVTINQKINKTSSFSLAELTSLKNYSFVFKTDNAVYVGSVYSSTNWSYQKPVDEEYIGNYVYTKLGSDWFRQPNSNKPSSMPYISVAESFINLEANPNNKLSQEGSCQIDNIEGTVYSIQSPSADKKYLTIDASACLANQSHYLLAYVLGSKINFSLSNLQNNLLTYAFQITSINQTKPLVAPSNFIKD